MTEHGGEVNHPVSAVLETLRRDHPGVLFDLVAPPERLNGGFWAELWSVVLAEVPAGWPDHLVIRIAPDRAPARWEIAAQRATAGQGFSTPAVRAWGGLEVDDRDRPWCVMDHADGAPLLAGLDGVSAIMRLPSVARRLPDDLARVMASLHGLDPQPLLTAFEGLHDRPCGVGAVLDHLAETARALDARDETATLERLRATIPGDPDVVICHGDLHPFNVLADGNTLTVIDWTAAQVAPAAFDVAFTSLLIEVPPLQAPPWLQATISFLAGRVARRFRRRYSHVRDRPIDGSAFKWFQDLHSVRLLLEVANWERNGELEAMAGHPFVGMAPTLRSRLASRR